MYYYLWRNEVTNHEWKGEHQHLRAITCHLGISLAIKKYECRKCEDWGGGTDINGYYHLVCPQCKKDFETTKTDYWKPSYRHRVY